MASVVEWMSQGAGITIFMATNSAFGKLPAMERLQSLPAEMSSCASSKISKNQFYSYLFPPTINSAPAFPSLQPSNSERMVFGSEDVFWSEEDLASLAETKDVELLKQAWWNKKAAPEILAFQASLVQRSNEQIQLLVLDLNPSPQVLI